MKQYPSKPTLTVSVFFALILCVLFLRAAEVKDFLGTEGFLRTVQDRLAKPATQADQPDAYSQLRADLKAFSTSATNLPPAEAAQRWLAFVDRAAKIQPSLMGFSPSVNPINADDLLSALPPPTAWNDLAKAVAARPAAKGGAEIREVGLRLLVTTLTGDIEGRKSAITNLQAQARTANTSESYLYRSLLQQIRETMLAQAEDPAAILNSLEYQLANSNARGRQNLRVPDLVSQLGAAKAEAFLRKALVQPGVTLRFDSANATSRLAQKLALELMPQLKTVQWGLVNSLDSIALYEAMDKQFPDEKKPDPDIPGIPELPDISFDSGFGGSEKVAAQTYYLLGLISHDRAKDAVAIAKKLGGGNNVFLPEPAFRQMEQAGYTEALDEFFYELLTQDPTLSFWNDYVQLAAKAGKTERMLTLVRAAAARQDLPAKNKAAIRGTLFKALLAADDVDEGVQEMRRLIALDPTGNNESAGQLGIMLAQLGVLLQKPDLTSEGIEAARKWLAKSAGNNDSARWESPIVLSSLVKLLQEQQRGPEAEAILAEALATAVKASPSENNWSGNDAPRQILTDLAALYHQAGRPADVVALLKQSPYWGAKDFSELLDAQSGEDAVAVMNLHSGSAALTLPYIAASAFAATGQREQALKLTDALLQQAPGSDRGYELLLALDPTNALTKLDALFARDQFEERPLIWKAKLLQQQGQSEAAEKVVRQAIAIDPSDGEEGRGDRMRAYSVLAEIRAARGDNKEADFYREVVRAIRLSENADQCYLAGLLKRAVAMYEDALTHFSDAYCIQSRLARQLSALGENEAAEEHYRRAFELMPDSFGRVESHCFGCEQAFAGERAQGIAEKVFTKIAAERPDKPQVHYLLGYLREEEERFNEASTNYLTAVRLDPEYLNAWVRLNGISEHILLPAKTRDEIALNILRLDPLRRHAYSTFGNVSDLAKLWNAVTSATQHAPPMISDLLALPASEAEMKKKTGTAAEESAANQVRQQLEAMRGALTPAHAVAENPFVQMAGNLLTTSANDGE